MFFLCHGPDLPDPPLRVAGQDPTYERNRVKKLTAEVEREIIHSLLSAAGDEVVRSFSTLALDSSNSSPICHHLLYTARQPNSSLLEIS